MKVILIPSTRSSHYHTTECAVVQRSAPFGLGCEHLDVIDAQRKGYTWCGQCRRSETVVA